jgi:4-hydroxy-tetrahydrodipicolinate synthase
MMTLSETASPFGRLLTAMVTPFDQELNIDYKAVERIVNHLIGTGTEGIIVGGTCGESPTLEDSERYVLLNKVISIAKGRAKVLLGAGFNSTKKAARLSSEAEKLGADGILSVVPYYNKPSQAGLIEHFAAIAKATPLPIIVYNIPGRTSINLTIETTLHLAEKFPNIIALKDCFGSTDQAAEIIRLAPERFSVYTGDDHLILPVLAIGGCGVISTAGSLVGGSISQIISSYLQGNVINAKEIYYQCLPLFKGLFTAPNPTCLKYAMSRQGLCSPYLRLPLIQLNEQERSALDRVLDASPLDPVDTKVPVTTA